MRKSSSPSLSNCNSVLTNKIFGIPLDELQQEGQPGSEVPLVVRHVVDYIEEHGGLEQEGLFQVNGNAETVEWLRQRYDNGEDVDLVKEADVPSAISLLRFFLQALPEPVIPGTLHMHLTQLCQDYNEDEFGRKLRFLLQQIPPLNYSLLKFLCRFLVNVAAHHEEIWSASSLAAVFGPDVFHIYTDVEDLKEQELVSRIMVGLLENYDELFENEEEDFSSNDLSSITEQVIFQYTFDFVSKVCDPNVKTESEELKNRNNAPEATLCVPVPHLDLKNVNGGDKWEEPFPAFKSWQEDSESGEAQLSPQAGRMNHPLEEDIHPILSHRSLDFGQSQRFLHDPDKIDPSSKALSFVRTRRASFSSSKDDRREEKTPYQLVKKLQKKIRQFEEQFEKDKHFKPSYSDIAANPKVLKWMTELTKLKKQIKDAKHKSSDGEFIPQTRPRSNTLPKSFGSSLDHEDEENEDDLRAVQKEKKPTKEVTVELIFKRLKEKRIERALPEDIKKMTKDHLSEEKILLQKSLLYYESQHGRPVSREERNIVKPLYDRYRRVKQMLTRASITPILGSPSTKRRSQMLQPIIEGETAHFFDEIKEEEEEEEEGNLSSELSDFLKSNAEQMQSIITSPFENSESDVEESQEKLTRELRLSSTCAASMPELLEQLWKARAEKKKLRKTLREFEEGFYQQNGRNVQKEDRAPMLDEYREYKKVKAKLRLLEVLISKQDSSK
uniref:Family with sequence similarity 13 member B n=1 Tax=Varanus komodoensis TaxID=61221 RepID=A0A8D2LG84_VARKO